MARRICTGLDMDGNPCTRSVGTGPSGGWEDTEFSVTNGFCNPCGDEGQMQIAHLNGHESISEADCWYCHPELDARALPVKTRKGHTNTVARSHNSHAGHGHPRTPKGRAACRASIAAGNGPLLPPPAKKN